MISRIILSISVLLFAVGYLVRSIPFARALPQVSLGTNPIAHQMFECNSSENFTNTSSNPFIITDLLGYSANYQLIMRLDGTRTVALHGDSNTSAFVDASLVSGIVVSPNQVVDCTAGASGRYITISGYYAHP